VVLVTCIGEKLEMTATRNCGRTTLRGNSL